MCKNQGIKIIKGLIVKMAGVNGRLALCCLFSFCSLILSAQMKDPHTIKNKKRSRFLLEVQYSPGKVAPVYPYFPKNLFSNAVELHLGYQTTGEQLWNKLFNYPRLGVSLIYQNLGNNQILGQQFSIVPTVYFSTAHKENAKVYADFRYGLGIACFNRKYDSITNPHDWGVGEHFTWQFTIGANLHWNFSPYAAFQLGGIWYHASDSHTQLPNVGVNNFSAYLGLVIYPFGRSVRVHDQDTTRLDTKWHSNFRYGSGYQEKGGAFGPVGGKKYPVYTGAIYASKRVAKVIMLKVGAMYRYYPMYLSVLQEMPREGFTSNQKLKSSAFIVFTGFEFLLGHFAISLEAGINVYKPAYKPFYNEYEPSTAVNYWTQQLLATRFGANYYILDPYKHPRNNVFLGAYVSATAGEAEFLELNIGYVF